MRGKSYETYFPHPASYPYQSRRDEEIEAKINKSNQPIRYDIFTTFVRKLLIAISEFFGPH